MRRIGHEFATVQIIMHRNIVQEMVSDSLLCWLSEISVSNIYFWSKKMVQLANHLFLSTGKYSHVSFSGNYNPSTCTILGDQSWLFLNVVLCLSLVQYLLLGQFQATVVGIELKHVTCLFVFFCFFWVKKCFEQVQFLAKDAIVHLDEVWMKDGLPKGCVTI